ncbi:hypothetical protein BKI52_19250 [marine bacterium AO1-C]|nr:hypothetical protein BKI52_19250 [marine bacterium AO1-C]
MSNTIKFEPIEGAYTDDTPSAVFLNNQLFVTFTDKKNDTHVTLAYPNYEGKWRTQPIDGFVYSSEALATTVVTESSFKKGKSLASSKLYVFYKGEDNQTLFYVNNEKPTESRSWGGGFLQIVEKVEPRDPHLIKVMSAVSVASQCSDKGFLQNLFLVAFMRSKNLKQALRVVAYPAPLTLSEQVVPVEIALPHTPLADPVTAYFNNNLCIAYMYEEATQAKAKPKTENEKNEKGNNNNKGNNKNVVKTEKQTVPKEGSDKVQKIGLLMSKTPTDPKSWTANQPAAFAPVDSNKKPIGLQGNIAISAGKKVVWMAFISTEGKLYTTQSTDFKTWTPAVEAPVNFDSYSVLNTQTAKITKTANIVLSAKISGLSQMQDDTCRILMVPQEKPLSPELGDEEQPHPPFPILVSVQSTQH